MTLTFLYAFALASGLASAAATGSAHLQAAQPLNPCSLLTADEIQPLAPNTNVPTGVPRSAPSFDYSTCRHTWGAGTGRFRLDVAVSDPSRMFPDVPPDQMKQRLLAAVRPGADDAAVAEIGDAAVFTLDSSGYASATALVKGRILQVHLDGFSAHEKKNQIIAVLKTAASRL
jgi:hypothetical protein